MKVKKLIAYIMPFIAIWYTYQLLNSFFGGMELLCLGCGPTYKAYYPFPIYKEVINPLGFYFMYIPGVVLNLAFHSFSYAIYFKFVKKNKFSVFHLSLAVFMLIIINIMTWFITARLVERFGGHTDVPYINNIER